MPDATITFEFDEHPGLYWPGEAISGQYRVETAEADQIRAIELSVLWYTTGKGDEDFSVHYFQRAAVEEQGVALAGAPHRFAAALPKSPLSYDGVLLKITWCVRVRVFFRRGRDVVAEQPFQLGILPRPKMLRMEQSSLAAGRTPPVESAAETDDAE